MEATGCRLAMTGHSTLVIVSVYLRLQTVAPARPKSSLPWGCRQPLRQYTVSSDHRPVILKWDLRRREAYSIRKITNWKRVSTALEEIDTTNLNSIPNDRVWVELTSGALIRTVRERKRRFRHPGSARSFRRDVAPNRVEVIGIHKGKTATSCQLQTDQPPERSGQPEKILKTRLSDHLLGKGLIIDEQFGFPQRYSTASPPLSRAREHSLDRASYQSRNSSGLYPLLLLYSAYTNDVPRPSSSGVQLALFADDTAHGNRNRAPDSPSSPPGAIDELGQWFRKWRIEVKPTNQQPYNSSMGWSRLIVDKNLPILKCWMRSFRGNELQILGVTLKITLRSYRAC
ncbi:hypothetical protein EVAR_96476_1 [Eumeta japonica]|uniref:Uncharacterized protein n=1 Tax=Eumeta variegata TaxID=151549 RepID=A0A4C1VV02_EUMVA|nr:hypothetical protein EVAR_96476_1 [Eumeta japonica]